MRGSRLLSICRDFFSFFFDEINRFLLMRDIKMLEKPELKFLLITCFLFGISFRVYGSPAVLKTPDPYAMQAQPSIKKPPSFDRFMGFDAELLEPFKDEISQDDRQQIINASKGLLGSESDGLGHALKEIYKAMRGSGETNSDVSDFSYLSKLIMTENFASDFLTMDGDGEQTESPLLPFMQAQPSNVYVSSSNSIAADQIEGEEYNFSCTTAALAGAPDNYIQAIESLLGNPIESSVILAKPDEASDVVMGFLGKIRGSPLGTLGKYSDLYGESGVGAEAPLLVEIESILAGDSKDVLPGTIDHVPKIRKNRELKFAYYLDHYINHIKVSYPKSEEPLRRAFQLLLPVVARAKEKCKVSGGSWQEVVVRDDHSLNLFSCRDREQQLIGLSAKTELAAMESGFEVSYNIPFSQQGVRLSFNSMITPDIQIMTIKDGLFLSWYNDATPRQWGSVENDGPGFGWNRQGLLKSMISRSEMGFVKRTWYPNKILFRETRLNKEQDLKEIKEWHDNGRLRSLSVLKRGRVEGERQWWHRNGRPAGLALLKDDLAEGLIQLWYDDGKLAMTGNAKEGVPEGVVTWSYPNGQLAFQGEYKNKKADGMLRMFRPDGSTIIDARYIKGKMNGVSRQYYANGSLRSEISSTNGKFNGDQLIFYSNGSRKQQIVFDKNKNLERSTNFFANGQIEEVCEFDKHQLKRFKKMDKEGRIIVEGKIELGGTGSKSIYTKFRSDGTELASCQMPVSLGDASHRIIRQCQFRQADGVDVAYQKPRLVAGQVIKAYDDKKLVWLPEKCGGFESTTSYDTETENATAITMFQVKEACIGAGLANSVICISEFKNDKFMDQDCRSLGAEQSDETINALQNEQYRSVGDMP